MATSGQINTNTTYESYFWVKWEQNGDQDIANNRTPIKWSCGLYSEHKFYSNAVKMSAFSINGTQVYSGGTYSNFTAEGNQTIASGTMWITHDLNGAKTFSISAFTGWLYSNHNYSSSGGSYTLTTIPRQATITSAPNFTDWDNPTIYYSNPAGTSATGLIACISFTGAKDDIAYRDINKDGNSYPFSLTDEERNVLRINTSGSSRKLYFYVRTSFGSTTFYSYKEVTFSIVEDTDSKPSITMTATLDNGSLPSEFDGLCIQGKSRYDVALSAEPYLGANITSLYAVADGKTYNSASFKTEAIQFSGDIEIVGYAKDSRGFSNSATQPITVIPYSKPLVVPIDGENAIQCYRSDGNGKRVGNSTSVWIKAQRTFYSVSGKNLCALQWRKKLITEEWNEEEHLWNDLLSKSESSTDEYDALISDVVFDLKKSYTVQIRAIDDIGEADVKTIEIPTEDVALHLGKGGKNVSVGSYCDYSEEYTFHSKWKAIFDKGVYIGKTPINDYVIEQGTEGIWTYRKWNSGLAECWGRLYCWYSNAALMRASAELPFDITNEFVQGTICFVDSENVSSMRTVKCRRNNKDIKCYVYSESTFTSNTELSVDVSVKGYLK